MAESKRLFQDRDARLITLTGSGGCGKTRLAIEAAKGLAKSYRDGVWLVELASFSDAAHLPQTFMASLELAEQREDFSTNARQCCGAPARSCTKP